MSLVYWSPYPKFALTGVLSIKKATKGTKSVRINESILHLFLQYIFVHLTRTRLNLLRLVITSFSSQVLIEYVNTYS